MTDNGKLLPTPGRAGLNRWAWWWQQHLGWAGLAAALALAVAIAMALVVRPALERARADNLRQQVQRLAALTKVLPVTNANDPDPRDAWRAALPAWRERGRVVRELLLTAQAAKTEFDRADYAHELKEPGLVQLQATLPLTASYAQVRQVAAGILNELPNATLDALELERSQTNLDMLAGRLRVNFYFRGED